MKNRWYSRLIVAWIAQDEEDPEQVEGSLEAAANEQCFRLRRQFEDLDIPTDVQACLEIASRRLANRLFGDRELFPGKHVATFPIAYPFVEKEVSFFMQPEEPGYVLAAKLTLPSEDNNSSMRGVLTFGNGHTAEVALFLHTSKEHRALSLSYKLKELIQETVRDARKRLAPYVPLSAELRAPNTLGWLDARVTLKELIRVTGVRVFVDFMQDDPTCLDLIDGPLPARMIRERLDELEAMQAENRRQVKSRARKRILSAFHELGLLNSK